MQNNLKIKITINKIQKYYEYKNIHFYIRLFKFNRKMIVKIVIKVNKIIINMKEINMVELKL